MCSKNTSRNLEQTIMAVDDMKLLFPRQKFYILLVNLLCYGAT